LVDLHAALAAVQTLIEPTARAHSVRIEARPCSDALLIRTEEAELQNLLVNILLNAVQASRPGGKVVVTTEGGDAVRIRVADQGCGIAPEFQKRVFEPFFSLRQGGTGLGLFLSLNFVRRWGGDIRLESTPGKGTTFEVVFPAMRAAAVETAP
jgi:two-component system NtrC family sensor kinase